MRKEKLFFVLLYIALFFFHAPEANSANITLEYSTAMVKSPVETEYSADHKEKEYISNPAHKSKDIIIQSPIIKNDQRLNNPMLIPGKLDIDPRMLIPGNSLIDPRMLIGINPTESKLQNGNDVPKK